MAFNLSTLRSVFIVTVVLTVIAVLILEQKNNLPNNESTGTSIQPGISPWYLRRTKSFVEIAESYNRFINAKIDHNGPNHRIQVNLTSTRINRLLRILQESESHFYDQLVHLEVMMIDKLQQDVNQEFIYFKQYEYEFNEFTIRDGKHLTVNDKFANMLDKRSDYFTFANPNKDLSKVPLKKVRINDNLTAWVSNAFKEIKYFITK